jgi:hypothetical protein
MNDAKEFKVPCVLLVSGLAIYLAFGLLSGGPTGAAMVLLANAIELAVLVPLGIAACFIVAAILSTSFGSIGTASLKLAAIMVFPTSMLLFLALLIGPIFSILIAIPLYWYLIGVLFDLEPFEVIVTVIVIWLVRIAAFLFVTRFLGH